VSVSIGIFISEYLTATSYREGNFCADGLANIGLTLHVITFE